LDIKLDNFVLGYKSNQTQIVTRPVINLKLIDFNSSVINGWDIDRVQLTTMNSVLKPPELVENDIENVGLKIIMYNYFIWVRGRRGTKFCPTEFVGRSRPVRRTS